MPSQSVRRMFIALRGTVYAAGFVVFWGWVSLSVRRFDESLPVAIPMWLRPIGWLVLGAGAVVAALCVAAFISRGEGTPAPFDPPRRFVASGPYRYVRNPMYLGGFGVLLGIGIILGSPAMIALAVAFLLLAHIFVVAYEEPGLARRFGSSYDRYRETVTRWRPRRPADDRRR